MTKRARQTKPRHYWLVKSEPSSFSIDDLASSPKHTTCWDGVRNYQARKPYDLTAGRPRRMSEEERTFLKPYSLEPYAPA